MPGKQGVVDLADPSHRSLPIWHLAMDLEVTVDQATSSFPRDELYGLVSQVRRSSVSIPSIVAEDYGRGA